MERNPVNGDRYVRFHTWLIEMSQMYGVCKDPEVKRAVMNLSDKIREKISKPKYTKAKRKSRYVAFFEHFKKCYMENCGIEYLGNLNGKEVKNIENCLEKLDAAEVSHEIYINWLFEEFFPNNERLSPSISLVASESIIQTFMYKNIHVIAKNKQKKENAEEEKIVMQQIRVFARETGDKEVISFLEDYRDRKIDLYELKEKVNTIAKKYDRNI